MTQRPKKPRSPQPSDRKLLEQAVSGSARRVGGPCGLLVVCGLLLLAVALVFGKTVQYDFVNYDDDVLVRDNPMVARGVTAQGVVWALTANELSMWYPLTWLSYMLDSQMFGTKPWGYHLTNVLLHAATAVVLFLALWRMTGNLWASALVALLFAIHPLRAEAVAWVGERKSPLSGLFFASTIAAYVAYARRPFSLVRYLAVAALFTLGLLAKPTLVTLPFVLLLLDYWPLGRWRPEHRTVRGARKSLDHGALREPVENSDERLQGFDFVRNQPSLSPLHLVLEKIPLVLLSVACSVAAVLQPDRQYRFACRACRFLCGLRTPWFPMPSISASSFGRSGWPPFIPVQKTCRRGRWEAPSCFWLPFPWRPSCRGASSPPCLSAGCGTWARWCP